MDEMINILAILLVGILLIISLASNFVTCFLRPFIKCKWKLFSITDFFSVLVNPCLFFFLNNTTSNDSGCDGRIESQSLSESNILIIIIFSLLAGISYLYTSTKKRNIPPLVSLFLNLFMLTGIIIAISIASQIGFTNHFFLGLPLINFIGCIPFIVLMFMGLKNLHEINILHIEKNTLHYTKRWEKQLYNLLHYNLWKKYPVLMLLCLPFITMVSQILTLLGQKPDAIILAFTQTYHYTFSELICTYNHNTDCHYLCTVAAQGHTKFVKPTRLGIRNGNSIVVNRQLLIANAFEDILEDKFPKIHRIVRRNYDKYGFPLSKYIKNKWSSDITYLVMKPLEWIFLIVIYCVDQKPENRIAIQYIEPSMKKEFKEKFVECAGHELKK